MFKAEYLTIAGYRRTSNRYRIVARVDREDWKEHMAAEHSPWSEEQGLAWVEGLGDSAADFYRRCISTDKLTIASEAEFRKIPGSNHDPIGYINDENIEILKTVAAIMEENDGVQKQADNN